MMMVLRRSTHHPQTIAVIFDSINPIICLELYDTIMPAQHKLPSAPQMITELCGNPQCNIVLPFLQQMQQKRHLFLIQMPTHTKMPLYSLPHPAIKTRHRQKLLRLLLRLNLLLFRLHKNQIHR